jgi:hypothetical protein
MPFVAIGAGLLILIRPQLMNYGTHTTKAA